MEATHYAAAPILKITWYMCISLSPHPIMFCFVFVERGDQLILGSDIGGNSVVVGSMLLYVL